MTPADAFAAPPMRDDQIEDLRAALDDIRKWCEAYPASVFTPMSDNDFVRAHAALMGVGL